MAKRDAISDPAWRSQLLIGITVLNWLYTEGADREGLHRLASRLSTPAQRRLLLHKKWAERDLLSLIRPVTGTPARAGFTASRAAHTQCLRTAGGVTSRPVGWDMSDARSPTST